MVNELEIRAWINELDIRDNLKQILNSINDKIIEIYHTGIKMNFDIIIDERGKEETDILLEYITIMFEKYKIYNEVIKYSDNDYDNLANGIIVIDDFDMFYDKIIDCFNAEKRLTKFINKARYNNNMIIYVCSNKIEDNFSNISKKVFDPELCIHIKGDNKKEQYDLLLEKYRNANIKYNLSYNTFLKIIKTLEENKYDTNIVDYLYDYSVKKKILNNSKIINIKTFDEFIEKDESKKIDVNSLIGLENVKKEIVDLYNYLSFMKKIKIKENTYLNLFFLGNPGTGKTTVARIYADKLYKMGYLKENKIVEIVPNDLIGEYVGQTRKTTRKVLDGAKGGLLFIDEAYLLYSDSYSKGKNPFMEEAIVELIKYLEDPCNIVIFAGYTDEMKKIYDGNPGIKSRIYKEIYFYDYNKEELYEILNKYFNDRGLKILDKSKNDIIKYIDTIKLDKYFGNARSMMQLGQKMIFNHVSNGNQDLIITDKDLPKIDRYCKRMGFDIYD